jgi:hypothetical protein
MGRHPNEHDPPEPWEQWISRGEIRRLARDNIADRPFRPRRPDDVPPGAVEALAHECGAHELEQLFVIPSSPRRVGDGRWRWVETPTQVLGFGDHGVGLWVDATPAPGVHRVIPHADLAAIADEHILLYGRLSFLAGDQALRVRYNTVSRWQLQPALASVRRSVATQPGPVPDVEPPKLTHKWRVIADSETVRPAAGEKVAVFFGSHRPHRRRRAVPALLAVTSRELIVVRQPYGDRAGYGSDALYVSRQRIEQLEAEGSTLRLRTAGAHLELLLDEGLAAAALSAAMPRAYSKGSPCTRPISPGV